MIARYTPPWVTPPDGYSTVDNPSVTWIDYAVGDPHTPAYQHIYVPSTPCKVERSNVVGPSSGRDAAGFMHIDWVRPDVRKINLHYNVITATELQYMENLLQGQQFVMKFLQDKTNNIQVINAYAGESTYEHYSYSSIYSEPVYQNYEIHVIEM